MEEFFGLISNFIHGGGLEYTFSAANPSGLLILLFIAIITDIGIPVPFVLDTVLMFTAYRVFTTPNPQYGSMLLVIATLQIGGHIGSGILYLLSRLMGKVFLNWLNRHFPAMGRQMELFTAKLNRLAPLVVATGRLTPSLLQITSVAAGAIRLNYSKFFLGIVISDMVYHGVLVLLGFIAARTSRDPNFALWVLVSMIIIVSILWPIIFMLYQRNNKKPVAKAY